MPLRAQRRGGGTLLSMCNFGTTWDWVANATSLSFIPPEANRYRLHKRLSGHQGRSWQQWWTANVLHPLSFEHQNAQLVASRYPGPKEVRVRDNYHKWSSGEDVSNDTNITIYISIKIYSLQVRADYVRMKAGNSEWRDCCEENVLR
jgi:hypothetical protein